MKHNAYKWLNGLYCIFVSKEIKLKNIQCMSTGLTMILSCFLNKSIKTKVTELLCLIQTTGFIAYICRCFVQFLIPLCTVTLLSVDFVYCTIPIFHGYTDKSFKLFNIFLPSIVRMENPDCKCRVSYLFIAVLPFLCYSVSFCVSSQLVCLLQCHCIFSFVVSLCQTMGMVII